MNCQKVFLPMKHMAVIVSIPGVNAKVLDRLGALLGVQLHMDVAEGGVDDGRLVEPRLALLLMIERSFVKV